MKSLSKKNFFTQKLQTPPPHPRHCKTNTFFTLLRIQNYKIIIHTQYIAWYVCYINIISFYNHRNVCNYVIIHFKCLKQMIKVNISFIHQRKFSRFFFSIYQQNCTALSIQLWIQYMITETKPYLIILIQTINLTTIWYSHYLI